MRALARHPDASGQHATAEHRVRHPTADQRADDRADDQQPKRKLGRQLTHVVVAADEQDREGLESREEEVAKC